MALTTAGGVLAVLAVRRWQEVQAAMREGAELPRSWMPVLLGSAIVVLTIALIVVISVQP
jgi:putative membrane protein